jgi:uncharacterized membrane protein YccC
LSWQSDRSDGRGDAGIWHLSDIWPVTWPRVVFGLRLWASVSLALAVAFWLELDDAVWAGTTACIVCQPSLGASLRKGWFRAIGTIVGAMVIVALTSAFPQNREGMLLSLAIWGAACVFLATILHNFTAYAASLAGYTAIIIFADAVDNPANTFHIAVTRATEICLGILAAGTVLIMTDLGDARRRLAEELGTLAQGIATGFAATLTRGGETLASRTSRRELILRVNALDSVIDEAIGEASGLRGRSGTLYAASEGLFTALSAWWSVGNHLDTLPEAIGKATAAAFLPAVSEVEGDWQEDPERILESCDTERRKLLAMSAADLTRRVLADGTAELLGSLTRAANGLVLVTRPGHERPDYARHRLFVPDILPAVVNAVRVILTLIVVETIWVVTNWSGGQGMIVFAAIGTILFALQADEAYSTAIGFAAGTAIVCGIAGIVNFLVLPNLQNFLGLSLALGTVLVPIGVFVAGTWQKPVFSGMVTAFLPLLSPANPPVYDLQQFLNSALAINSGIIAAALFLLLIPPILPARRTQRLLALTLRDLRRLAVRQRWPDQQAWRGLVSSKLAAMPKQEGLEEGARLLAALSVGEAVIYLRDERSALPGQPALDRALACLAAPDLDGTRRELDLFSAQQQEVAMSETPDEMRAQTAALAISRALERHAYYFASSTVS